MRALFAMEEEIIKLLSSCAKVVGTKQVIRGLEEGAIKCVIVADDSDDYIRNKVTAAAKAQKVTLKRTSSMAELGKACGIKVKAAAVGLINRN